MIYDMKKSIIHNNEGQFDTEKSTIHFFIGVIGEVFLGDKHLNIEEILNYVQKEEVDKLAGRYTIVFINKKNNTVKIYRDPTGLQTIYFLNGNKRVIIYNNLSDFHQYFEAVNGSYISQYLNNENYISDLTIYEGIFRVRPGHVTTITDEDFNTKKFYKFKSRSIRYKDCNDYQEEFKVVFDRAIKRSIQSVGKLGLSLSGGLDSTSIYVRMCDKNFYADDINLYSLYYPNNLDSDESRYIKETLSLYPSKNHHFINADDNWTFKEFEKDFSSFKEPFHFIGSNLNKTLLNAMKIDGITHHLTGHGGDDVLNVDIYYLNNLYKKNMYLKLTKELLKNRKKYTSSELIEAIKNETSTQICNPYLLDSNKIKKNHFNWDEMNMDVYFDSIINNSNTEWMDININSRFNIEARYPFLDINLVEFLLNIPIEQKEQLSVSKYILRNSLKNLLPEKIYSRSTKSLNLPQLLLGLQKEKGNIMRYTNFEYLNQYEKTNKQKIEEDIKKLSKSTNETFYPIVNIAKLLSVELWLRSR